MDKEHWFFNGDDSEQEAELDSAFCRAEEYGTPPTRLTKSSKLQRLPPGLGRVRLTTSKSKDSLRSQDGKNYGKNLPKRQSRKAGKGGDAARKKIQKARIYKELNTTFQLLGIDAYLLKKEITASSHIPFMHTTSCGTSAVLSESDSEASSYSCSTSVSGLTGQTRRRSARGGTHTPLEILPPPLIEGANPLLEGYSEEFCSFVIPEKVQEAEMRGKEALDALAELGEWDLRHGDIHTKWINTIGDSLNEAQAVSREMRCSIRDQVSGSVETINSITEEGERIVAVLGGLIQELYEKIYERSIDCANGMAPCFKTTDETALKQIFKSTGRLLRSYQFLSESEDQLSMKGLSQSYFCLVMPPHSKARLHEALKGLLESASNATAAFQASLLTADNLSPGEKSTHEMSKAGEVLSLCWSGCNDLVSALSGDSELKSAAVREFAKTVSAAAAHACTMQRPFAAKGSLIQKQNVWKRSEATNDSRQLSDEVVQAHLWLLSCLLKLLRAGRTAVRYLKRDAKHSEHDNQARVILDDMRFNFYNLMDASTRRMSWLASRPESMARWALERIESQGCKVLCCVKQYDQGPIAFDVEYLCTQEGRGKYRVLSESTKQLVNQILNVQSNISLRRPRDEPRGCKVHSPQPNTPSKDSISVGSAIPSRRCGSAVKAPCASTSSCHGRTVSQGTNRSGRRVNGHRSLLTQAVRSIGDKSEGKDLDLGSGQQESVLVVRTRGLDPAMIHDICPSGAQDQPYPGNERETEGFDSEGGKKSDLCGKSSSRMDVFCMDDIAGRNDLSKPSTQRKASSLAVKSPFTSTAQQVSVLGEARARAQANGSVKNKGLSRVEMLQSPFLARPSGLGTNPSKFATVDPPVGCPMETSKGCPPSWTAQLNNLAGAQTVLRPQAPTRKASYADVLKLSLKKPQHQSVTQPNLLQNGSAGGSSAAVRRSPNETTVITNEGIMEGILSDKLAQCSYGVQSAVSTSQLSPAAEQSSTAGGLDRPGLPMSKMEDTKDIKWSHLTIRSVLGAGSSGQVFGCRWHGGTAAVKVLHQPADLHSQREFDWEIQMHQNLSFHPNIVQFRGVCKDFQENGTVGLVMELCEIGSLLRLIQEARSFRHLKEQGMLEDEHKRNPGYRVLTNWRRRLFLGRDVACGMRFIHTHNIIHRDLTSYNVVVDDQYRAKVCDFAKSRIAPKTGPLDRSDTIANSPAWSAPEIILGQMYTCQADVFSIGVILWELATLERPWEEQLLNAKHFDFDVMKMVSAGYRLTLPDNVGPDFPEWGMLKKLISDCWKLNPEDRPTMEQVHERLLGIIEIVDKRLRAILISPNRV